MVLALACECNSSGSTSSNCDANGICDCKADVIGDKCTTCKPGYSEFPSCSKPYYKSKQHFYKSVNEGLITFLISLSFLQRSLKQYIFYVSFVVFSNFLLVSTGYGNGFIENTEVLDLYSKGAQVPKYQNPSKPMSEATGGFVANKFITCGGAVDEGVLRECYNIGTANTTLHGIMKYSRKNTASIELADKLWVLGGLDAYGVLLKSTEYILHDGEQEDGPDLPVALASQTVIQINENNFMLLGGIDKMGGYTNKTWVYSNENWADGPALIKARFYHSVGKIRDSVTHKDYIVVTGGTDSYNHFKDTEILELYGTAWKAGKLL